MPPITSASVVAAARDQVSARVEGEFVILNLADEVYYGLDGVGARVWELISEPRAVSEVAAAIAAEYEVDPETAERDLLALLEELAGRKLVAVHDPSAP